jgi:hypothetical protein
MLEKQYIEKASELAAFNFQGKVTRELDEDKYPQYWTTAPHDNCSKLLFAAVTLTVIDQYSGEQKKYSSWYGIVLI